MSLPVFLSAVLVLTVEGIGKKYTSLLLLLLFFNIENVSNDLSSFIFLKQMLSRGILLLRGIDVCAVQILPSGIPVSVIPNYMQSWPI